MLIRFSVSNFKSFNQIQTFDMLSYNRLKKKKDHVIFTGEENLGLLKTSLIYGANASGKSNLIEAIKLSKDIITGEKITKYKDSYCRVTEDNKVSESKFNFEFCVNNKYYMYGFSLLLFDEKIVSEWLYQISKTNRKPVQKYIFERIVSNNSINFNNDFFNFDEDRDRLKVYENDFAGNQSLLFLSEINHNKNIDIKSTLNIFVSIYNWFNNQLTIIKPTDKYFSPKAFFSEKYKDDIERIISSFDTGIETLKNKKISFTELRQEISKNNGNDIAESIIHGITDRIREIKNKEKNVSLLARINEGIYSFEHVKDELVIKTLLLMHNGNSHTNFRFSEESDGTRRLFDFINILLDLEGDSVYIIDEIERSLHPNLTYKFFELFLQKNCDTCVQLITTTHESTIMTQDLIRRDEIWFVERNCQGESTLFPLREFDERYDKSLGKAYLEGRYGALPIFRSINKGSEK